MQAGLLELLVASPPKLHFWGGKWRVGGLGPLQIRMFERSLAGRGPSPRVIETGAGLSTLVFLALGARVTSFFTKEDLRERIVAAMKTYDLALDRWDTRIGPSEFTFPKYLDENPDLACDLVLIDGGHLIQTVFTDFTYAYAALKQNGLMLIDDIQMGSVAILHQILQASNFVEQVDLAGKTVAFRKKVKARLPGAWGDAAADAQTIAGIAADWDQPVPR